MRRRRAAPILVRAMTTAPPPTASLAPESEDADSARFEPLRDCVEAIGADDVITAKEYVFLKQKIEKVFALAEGETVDGIAKQALKLFAPHAKPEGGASLQARIAKLKPALEAVCSDGVVSLQEIEFLKKKVVELALVRPGDPVEPFLREALQPLLGRVRVEAAAQQALSGARAAQGSGSASVAITVVVTADGREARAVVEKGQRWSAEDVLRALAEAGVVHGIDRRWVEGRPPLAAVGSTVVLAKATEPETGEARTVTWHVPTRRSMTFEFESSRLPISFDADTFVAPFVVEAGTLLATLSRVTFGAPGVSVRGAPIAGLPGASALIFTGSGVRTSDDGLEVYAEVRGGLQVSDRGVVEVLPVFEVPAGSSEHLDIVHTGPVVVRGDMGSGSRIIATGDVYIEGGLEGGSVRSGGSVVVRGGLFRRASVRAAVDVIARRLEGDASIEAGGNVFVLADAIGSRLDGGSFVAVLGSITGGVARARSSVEADALSLGRASEMTVEVHAPGPGATPGTLRAQLESLAHEAARARGALANAGAEAGATKLAALRPLVPSASRSPLGTAPRPGAPVAPVASRAPTATPTSTASAESPPRIPITSPDLLSGENLPPITTAGSLRIDLREDEALSFEIDMAFTRSRLAVAEETTPLTSPRIIVRSSIDAGIRLSIEGVTAFLSAPKTDVACTVVGGAFTFQGTDDGRSAR